MKKIFTLIVFSFIALCASAQGSVIERAITKQTHLYAVKGADSLYLDHYAAPIEGKRPCVMFVFGGGFVGGARDHDTEYFLFLANNGYDVVSIDYHLGMRGVESPGIIEFLKAMDKTINIAVEDLYSATNFILDHAEEWQIDPEKIVVSGSSAGAITSLQAEYAICNSLPVTKGLKEGFNYAGVIAFAGAVFTLDGAPKWEKRKNSSPFLPIVNEDIPRRSPKPVPRVPGIRGSSRTLHLCAQERAGVSGSVSAYSRA